jgi:phosphoribosylcarboxyaminoimidazole (NCAIR) mutase
MPKGVPVATVAVGSAGAVNAVVLAAQILGIENPEIKSKLREFKKKGCKL